ncbi:pseudouridine synthase [Microvirga thermotolerans]|uniref:Pseudouridine synthase n=1 Tax=Microvirga thermotolerans TaxID=2651334 RepID=A0A5P9JWY5_9HYPH|nr:pseudouridine synthase [Microvirga thermotolerans]QFU15725.1 pseudouridine synthase [Microvirga thermotolerans]
MTDSNDERRKGRPSGRSDRGRTSGDRPFKSRKEGDRPLRSRGGDAPWTSRKGPEKPFRGRGGDERPRRPAPHREAPAEAQPAEPAEERIAKVIARAGVASRRDAEAMIAEGRVTLNGTVLDSPAVNVKPSDRIAVDGEPLPAKERTRLWLYHKPRGLVTTARDPEGRPTVFENLPEDLPRVVAVGRLDINTEGLLLLTNDGGLAKVIAHPDTGWLRRYKVRAHGDVTQADLDRLKDGVTIDGMEYGPIEARLDRVQGDNVWLTLGLREGKNREVKRILEHLGLQVNRLIRLSFGPFQLGDLEPGLVEEVRTRVLKDQLGTALAAEAGVDFESPVREPIAPFGSPKKERAEPGERRDERPSRFGRDRGEERPRRRRDEDERPFRPREGGDRLHDREEEPRKRPSRLEPKRSVWRADETEEPPHRKAPRRGLDPKAVRAASAERQRQRVGAIATGEGRKVVVERLVSEPREEPPARPRKSFGRPAPGGEDRPRRHFGGSEAPRRERDERPFKPRRGEGPARPGGKGRPGEARGGFKGGRKNDGPRSGGPRSGGPKGGGPKGGGPRGGPRGRR